MKRLVASLAGICIATLAMQPASLRAESPPSEYAVKTALVYKITKFVSWPESAFELENSVLNICVARGSSFAKPIKTLQGRKVRKHTIEIVVFADVATVDPNCQVLVVSRKEAKQADMLLAQVEAKPVLTIGDSDGFAENGGIIGLELQQSRVGFAINVEASQQVGIGINAQLLQLAKIVVAGGA